MLKKIDDLMARIVTSGPLAALMAFGLVMWLAPSGTLASIGYTKLFQYVDRWLWGVLSIAFSLIGYYGLFFYHRKAWLIAHGFAVVLFTPAAFFFGTAGSLTGFGTYGVLALNSWYRYKEKYRPIYFGISKRKQKTKQQQQS